jgi:mycothiol system anti-sigma-R factor
MSCGDLSKPDCADALARLEFFIDNELEHADIVQIKKHIDECAPCLAIADLERVVKKLVARSCSEHAPDELRQRVLVRIRQVSVTITEQQTG